MALTQNTPISGYTTGDHLTVRRTINALPSGRTIVSAVMTVRHSPLDANYVWQKAVTGSDVPGTGQVEDDGTGDGIAVVRFDIAPADAVEGFAQLVHDIQVEFDNGEIHTVFAGSYQMRGQVTQASS